MAMMPEIALQTRVAPIGNQLLQGYQAGSQIRQQREEAPLRNRLLTAQATGAEQQQRAGAQRQLDDETKSLFIGSAELKQYVDNNDYESAARALTERSAAAKRLGLPSTHSDEGLQMLAAGDTAGFKKAVDGLYSAGMKAGVLQEPNANQQSLTGDVQLAREMGIDLSSQEGRQAFQQFKLGQRPQAQQPSSYFSPVQTGEGLRLLNARTGELTMPTGQGGAPLMAPAIDPNAQRDVTLAKEGAKIEGKAGAQAKVDLPQTIATGEYSLNLLDEMLSHPGLDAATGASSKADPRNFIPGTDAYNFNVLRDQVQGQTFLQAFQTLRGGGTITEVEGTKAQNAIARMNTAQSKPEFVKALNEFKGIINGGLERARKKAGSSQQPPAQGGHAVGSIIEAGGKRYRVTGGDPNDPDVEEVQ